MKYNTTRKLEALHNAIKKGIGKRFSETPEGTIKALFNRDCYVVDTRAITDGLVPMAEDVNADTPCTVEAYAGDAMALIRFASGDEALAYTWELNFRE